ncbi:two pore domain potassium channel family protein [Pseudoalteromonas sp. SG43-1]|uniref:potassium channel family protein n=1 Tax=Pseudoalteromonas sp. SG43-1 TaxID=2760971 RepID=UPI001600A162|nr:potassium channel family protein [Pseudoalteromonas sp. SG43-1]MBB1452661.1 two pore domain potassium channel family protein [Pseudoalteromonas sp. SG43-1]
MISVDFESVLQLLITRVNEYGRYSAYDALRDYIEEEVIDGLEDATDAQIESFIHSQFEPLKSYLLAKEDLGLKVGKDLTCTKAKTVTNKKVSDNSKKCKVEFNKSLVTKGLTDLTKEDVRAIERQSLEAERIEDFENAFDGFEKLTDYYEFIDKNRTESLKMLMKKANAAKELNRADSYKYFSASADLLMLFYKNNEAGMYYEKAYQELKKKNTNTVSDAGIKGVDLLRKARLQFNAAGDEKKASKLFILENEEERKRTGSKVKYFYKILSNYGESPARVASWIVGVILVFALTYYIFDINAPSKASLVCTIDATEEALSSCIEHESKEITKQHPLTYVYFSTVTFTTLGYGDYSPLEGISRALASFQALLGLILSSLFIVTFVRRFSR